MSGLLLWWGAYFSDEGLTSLMRGLLLWWKAYFSDEGQNSLENRLRSLVYKKIGPWAWYPAKSQENRHGAFWSWISWGFCRAPCSRAAFCFRFLLAIRLFKPIYLKIFTWQQALEADFSWTFCWALRADFFEKFCLGSRNIFSWFCHYFCSCGCDIRSRADNWVRNRLMKPLRL